MCLHERLGASRPVCSIAFALCLLVQLILLFALVYVPCMCGLAPLAHVCSIAFALCLSVQHLLLLALVYMPRMRLGLSGLVCFIWHFRYACLCIVKNRMACTAACIIMFVAMLLCGSGATRPARCKALAHYVLVA